MTEFSDTFDSPAASAGVKWEDLRGALVIVRPTAVELGVNTAYGQTDAIRASVLVVDGGESGTEFPDALIFPKVLQGQLRSKVGGQVLGRVGQGVAKVGQSAPWQLLEATDDDRRQASDFIRARSAPSFSKPDAAAPAAGGRPW